MYLSEFISKNKVKLGKKTLESCNKSLNLMNKSNDPHHSIEHVNDLLADLDKFVNNNIPKFDYSILLPAICWHDVWKTTSRQSSSIFFFILENIWDGHGSARIFEKNSKELSKKVRKEIKIVIKLHTLGGLKILKKVRDLFSFVKTNETKILIDLDQLDGWSVKRIREYEINYLKNNPKALKQFALLNWYYNKIIKKYDDTVFYFDWPKKEFKKRKKVFVKEYQRILNSKKKYIK